MLTLTPSVLACSSVIAAFQYSKCCIVSVWDLIESFGDLFDRTAIEAYSGVMLNLLTMYCLLSILIALLNIFVVTF